MSLTTQENYKAVKKAYVSGKAAVTRAKNKGDHAKVIKVCNATFAKFDEHGWPDDWAHFQRAKDDAELAIRLAKPWRSGW